MADNRMEILKELGIDPENFNPKKKSPEERCKELEAEVENFRSRFAAFESRFAAFVEKSGLKLTSGELLKPIEFKPPMLVVKGLYYTYDGAVKKCIDGGFAKDFDDRFEEL